MRHGAATLSLQAGNELKVIQDKLGHASINLTADTYTSVAPELARHEAETTARLIADAARPSHRRQGRNRRDRIPVDGVRRLTSHARRLAGHPR
ncbi:hypothetical protein [Actinospica durhamensis]|uniref:hypothetical protein n=1 Tax=Actinospica durhamensis TaxID=1508375 RepID=UPI0034D74A50